MKIRNIKLLAIAPSESIESQLHEIVAPMDFVNMDIYVANHYQAVEIVKQCASLDYDAILSRGETASMIKKVSSIPVVEFPLSFYDVLQAMKLADNFNEPYAVVGFTPVTNIAHLLRDLMQLDLDIYTLFTPDDAIPTLERVKSKGYRLIVSGMGFEAIARRNGLNSILITTGKDSLASAIDQAIRLCTSLACEKAQTSFLRSLLEHSDRDTLVFDENGTLVFSALSSGKSDLSLSLATKRFQNHQRSDSVNAKITNTSIITIQEKNIHIGDEHYTVFYVEQQKKPYSSSKKEIQVFSRDEAIDIFLSHYLEISSSSCHSYQNLQQLIPSPLPVIILGEYGVGKRQIAATLYTQGCYQNHPFVIVDLEFATDKTWNYLLNHVNSPLNSEGITIYFRSLEALSPAKSEKLENALHDSGICKRSRIIFSYTTSSDTKLPFHITKLIDHLCCLTIRTIPLRQRVSEIRALASLYISTMNMELAKQVTGFTPKAMSLMEAYQWPGNLSQFSRIIAQLIQSASSPYIQEESVKQALAAETSSSASSSLADVINLDRTLYDIEKDIAKAVLEKTGGNQSQAAARLGICRTTLWRMLNK